MHQIIRRFCMRPPFFKIYPHCEECKNYIKYNHEAYSRCKKFSHVNFITDEKEYEYADYARRSERMCGNDGNHYVFRGSSIHRESSKNI